ncbi:MAG: DUF3883 domain-containing protein [Planctomycetes bacterium]|nr:DUF3883 domain-containing protein [Planctomycetota bacterium]
MPDTELKPGDIVAGLEPDEHVEVRHVAPFAGKTLVVGVTVTTRRELRRPLGPEELARVTVVRGTDYAYDGDAEAFLLGVEAQRIRIAYQFDPLFAVNSSVVDIVPHQVEAVYRYLLPLPRIRFLLADDTGAGKTIMAGLLIKELIFRRVLSKVLIIAPSGLTKQWREDEMQAKFGLTFRLLDRASFEAEPGQLARDEGLFITSVDYIARDDRCLKAAKDTLWDMIVVDEAHKLSAYEYGAKVERSGRYQAVEALVDSTDHLLFLTATPHRGRRDTFRRLLMLLDPDLFQKDEHVTERVREAVATYTTRTEAFEGEGSISPARNRFFLRRLKEEMINWDERPLFVPRHTKTTGYELTPQELDLYEAVTHYVRSHRKEAKAKRNRNVELTLVVMQRRLASSIYAITRTLRNRLDALDWALRVINDPSRTSAEKRRLLRGEVEDVPEDIAAYEELNESQREDIDRRIFRQVLSDDPEKVQAERDEVARLLRMAESLRNHPEAKFTELLKVLDESDVIRRDDEKLLIFTEHRDTMENLAERLRNKGYAIATIHGSMDTDARRQAQKDFRIRAKIMVATDAAGEGINLQFCRYLINWDVPWNPNRLEQRMGRIHRYGQKDTVEVYNLVATNTREGAVLDKVLRKLDVMREQMGDRVYDVIDELYEDVPLVELIERSIDADDPAGVADEAENQLKDEAGRRRKADDLIALQQKRTLTSHLDLREAQRLRDASDERRLQPQFIQRFFTAAYHAAGGTIVEDKFFPVYHVGATPSGVMDAARRLRLPVADPHETPFVFDKELVSVASKTAIPENTRLLGPGHPLFDALIEWAVHRAQDAFARGVTLVDPNIADSQRMWLVSSSIEDGRSERRRRVAHEQLSLVLAAPSGLRATSPANLLNCTMPDAPAERPASAGPSRDDVQAWAFEHLTEAQLERVRKDREAECALRRDYLEKTFTDLILDLQEKLIPFQQAQLFGEDDPEERQRLERRIRQLQVRKAERLAELELMLRLTANLPNVVTSALIVPAPVATAEHEAKQPPHGVPMRRDDGIERIGMEVAMRYETGRGWTPHDVSADGEHYDIRSESPAGDKRFIEVKGRAESGAIILTGPELDKLRQLGPRAWLYVVTFCKANQPRLRTIQDPIPKLNPEMLYRQVQFVVAEPDWSSQGEEVSQGGERA